MPFKRNISSTSKSRSKKTYASVHSLMVLVKEILYTIKDQVMVVTDALHNVKFQ